MLQLPKKKKKVIIDDGAGMADKQLSHDAGMGDKAPGPVWDMNRFPHILIKILQHNDDIRDLVSLRAVNRSLRQGVDDPLTILGRLVSTDPHMRLLLAP